MISLIHVLGSDIPHHNQTILKFFNDILANKNINAREFMIVSKNTEQNNDYPILKISFWSSKNDLAKAIISIAKNNRKQRFFFHGQFNFRIWLALLIGNIQPNQFYWHIWGADLYETSYNWKFRIFYFLRRKAQSRVGYVFATRGDLEYFSRFQPKIRSELLYFPNRTNLIFRKTNIYNRKQLTIFLGNSGDKSNEHIIALKSVYKQLGNKLNIIIPMGYPKNNKKYINKVRKIGYSLFSENNVKIINNMLEIEDYFKLIKNCDLGYFIASRQQGIGTICLFIKASIPCVLNRKNQFWRDMKEQNIPVLFNTDIINKKLIFDTKCKITRINKKTISFFSPNYLTLWQKALNLASKV